MDITSAIRCALRITVLLLLFNIPRPPAVAAAPDQLARDFFHPPAANEIAQPDRLSAVRPTSGSISQGTLGRPRTSTVGVGASPRQIQISTATRSVGRGRVINSKPFQPPSDSVAKAATRLTAAKWIWYPEGNPAAAAPVGRRFFRRIVEVQPDEKIRAAHITLTADNAFELFVNGQRIGTGDNFHQPYTFEVTRKLRSGPNVLAVLAENAGDAPNPAGWIGVLTIEFAGGDSLTIPTDARWLATTAPTEDWQTAPATPGGWRAAMELGPPGMAPWGKVEASPAPPEDYCDYALVADVLRDMGVPPDFESAGPFRYLHRQAGATDIYFVANRTEHWAGADCTFRVRGNTPELCKRPGRCIWRAATEGAQWRA